LEEEVVLSPGEREVLEKLARARVTEGEIGEAAARAGVDKSTLASIVMLLAEKGLAETREEKREYLALTERGERVLREGAPEERLARLLAERGGEASVAEVKEALGGEAGVAIGFAKRLGVVEVSQGRVRLARAPEEALAAAEVTRRLLEEVASGRGVPAEAARELLRRGLVERRVEKRLVFRLARAPEEVLARARVEVGKLTHELLAGGAWRRASLRPYNVRAEPPRLLPARKHFLQEFIEMLRDIMRELGFEEVRGPIVEVELFNFDLLFQAQDHPAREIHDTLWIKEPRRASLEEYSELVERVARVHERGWGYKWDPAIASRLLLRSQTTSVSARVLASRPESPIRFFTVGRVYRSDVVDATHLPEFHQLDGIMGWPGYTFRDLLGLLQEVASRLGLRLKLKPGYFPFTEPSVEGYVRLPNGKWLELFGAGMFRPEVLEAAGVDYPVGAWGFGVERLAAAVLGIHDIRHLYTRDVDMIRAFKVKILRR